MANCDPLLRVLISASAPMKPMRVSLLRFTWRAWAFALIVVSAGSQSAGLWFFSADRLGLFTALVLIAELAIVLQGNAVGGWVADFVPDRQRGRVGGWTNAANLGGGALGAMFLMSAAEKLATRSLAAHPEDQMGAALTASYDIIQIRRRKTR